MTIVAFGRDRPAGAANRDHYGLPELHPGRATPAARAKRALAEAKCRVIAARSAGLEDRP